MKKSILKIFGAAALAVAMICNVQLTDSVESSFFSLAELGSIAVAQNEGAGKCYKIKRVTIKALITTCDENGNNCTTEYVEIETEVKEEVPCPIIA